MKFRLLLGILLVGANVAAAETRHTNVCVSKGDVEVASSSVSGVPMQLPPGSCTDCPGDGPCAAPGGAGGIAPATMKALLIGGGAAAAAGIGLGTAAGVGAFDSSHSGETVRSREQ